MSLYVDPKQAIIDATNTANATALKLTDVTFGTPAVASSDTQAASGKNTSVRLTGNGTTWSGTVVVNYTRRNLNDLTTLVGDTLKVASNVKTVADLVKYLNYFYGMVLTNDDLEVTDTISLDANGAGTITIRAKSGSYGWVGQYVAKLVKGDDIVDYAVTDTSLNGLNYPTGQSALGQAPLALYGYDFTAYKTLLDALPTDTVLNSTTAGSNSVALADAFTALDFAGSWASSTSASVRNIYMSKVVYSGLNKPEFSSNQSYKYVMMIQLSDGSGNNGVAATPKYNTGFVGLLYVHWNDPIDASSTT